LKRKLYQNKQASDQANPAVAKLFTSLSILGASGTDKWSCFLSAAYDTVNHQRLISKLYDLTKDIIRVFSPKSTFPCNSTLYNIYTNDQPINEQTRRFIYADDTAVATQCRTFTEVEYKLSRALDNLAVYYKNNHLKPNPTKTQVVCLSLQK